MPFLQICPLSILKNGKYLVVTPLFLAVRPHTKWLLLCRKLVQEYDGRKDLEELTGDWDDRNKDSAKIFTALCLKTNQWFEDNIENRKKRGK